MASCTDIITDALVWRGVLAEGRAANAKMIVGGMNVLRSLYLELINSGALGALQPVSITADYTARPFQRIINTSGSSVSVTLPETVSGYCADAVAPGDRAVIVIVENEAALSYIYTANIAVWHAVETLLPESDAPMGETLRDGLTAALAKRLRYPGVPVDPEIPTAIRSFYQALTHHYAEQRCEVEPYRPYCDYLPCEDY